MSASSRPVTLQDVRFSYRGTEVLRGVDLELDDGQICALVGDNGAGKSTIARLVVGELAPDSGSVRLFGQSPARFRDWGLVGYVPQLPPEAISRFPASVLELVDASQYSMGRRASGRERRARSEEALARVGLAAYGRRIIRELSGGQLQRVRLACALVGDPRLLVLDEPTNGLDRESRSIFYQLVADAHDERGLAVLLVTHDLAPLGELGCRVVEIADGVAVERGGGDGRGGAGGRRRTFGRCGLMLAYVFMQRGLAVGVLLGVVIPLVGVTVVLKRLSMIGDALSHTSLAGVAAGLVGGLSPVGGAILACLTGALCIEGIRRRFRDQSELAVAVVMAAGIGLAGVLSGFVPNASSFNSFMFGSILTVSAEETATIAVISALAVLVCLLMRRELFLMSFDERHARAVGVPVSAANFAFVIVVALVVAVASRTVGSLIVSSMMVVPVACALQLARSWRQTCVISSVVGVVTTVGGLVVSYYFGLKPGGTIVLMAVALLLVILAGKKLASLLR